MRAYETAQSVLTNKHNLLHLTTLEERGSELLRARIAFELER